MSEEFSNKEKDDENKDQENFEEDQRQSQQNAERELGEYQDKENSSKSDDDVQNKRRRTNNIIEDEEFNNSSNFIVQLQKTQNEQIFQTNIEKIVQNNSNILNQQTHDNQIQNVQYITQSQNIQQDHQNIPNNENLNNSEQQDQQHDNVNNEKDSRSEYDSSQNSVHKKRNNERRSIKSPQQNNNQTFVMKNGCCRDCMKAFSKSGKSCLCQVPKQQRRAFLPLNGCKFCGCTGCNRADQIKEKRVDDKPKNKDEGHENYTRRHKMNDYEHDYIDLNEKGILSLGQNGKSRQYDEWNSSKKEFEILIQNLIGINSLVLGIGTPFRHASYILGKPQDDFYQNSYDQNDLNQNYRNNREKRHQENKETSDQNDSYHRQNKQRQGQRQRSNRSRDRRVRQNNFERSERDRSKNSVHHANYSQTNRVDGADSQYSRQSVAIHSNIQNQPNTQSQNQGSVVNFTPHQMINQNIMPQYNTKLQQNSHISMSQQQQQFVGMPSGGAQQSSNLGIDSHNNIY